MNGLFDQDRAFWRFINKTADLVILNVITFLLSMPIITIGPAYTALYYSTVKTLKKGRGYPVKNYFHSFKQNLFQGTVVWMILLIGFLSSSLLAYVNYKASTAGGMAQFLFWLGIVIALMFFCMMLFAFPVLSRFDFSTKTLLSFTYLIMIRYFTYTLGILFIAGVCIFAGYLFLPLVVIILPGLFVYTSSSMIERIFKVYMPKFEAVSGNSSENTEECGDEIHYLGSNNKENYDNVINSSDDSGEENTKEEKKDQWYYE